MRVCTFVVLRGRRRDVGAARVGSPHVPHGRRRRGAGADVRGPSRWRGASRWLPPPFITRRVTATQALPRSSRASVARARVARASRGVWLVVCCEGQTNHPISTRRGAPHLSLLGREAARRVPRGQLPLPLVHARLADRARGGGRDGQEAVRAAPRDERGGGGGPARRRLPGHGADAARRAQHVPRRRAARRVLLLSFPFFDSTLFG